MRPCFWLSTATTIIIAMLAQNIGAGTDGRSGRPHVLVAGKRVLDGSSVAELRRLPRAVSSMAPRRAQSTTEEMAVEHARALLRFRHSGNADGWPEVVGWGNMTVGNVCEWAGVSCSESGHVAGIWFGFNTNGDGLDFREAKSWVDGNITVLAEIDSLTHINLVSTTVFGSVSSLSALTELRYLNLLGTEVSGSVSSLGSLQHLKYLNLGGTDVHGDPGAFNVASMQYLRLPDGMPAAPPVGNKTSGAAIATASPGVAQWCMVAGWAASSLELLGDLVGEWLDPKSQLLLVSQRL